jgi:hypothetical protein
VPVLCAPACKRLFARWNFPSDRLKAGGPARSARQCGDEPGCQEIPRSARSERTLEGLPITRGKRPCLESCDPARGSRRMSRLEPRPAVFLEQGSNLRSVAIPRGRAPRSLDWDVLWYLACQRRTAPPDCRVCGLGLIRRLRRRLRRRLGRRFRRAPCRQVQRIARAKQAEASYLVRSGQVCFPFSLRPGNLTGRLVLSVIQYRK